MFRISTLSVLCSAFSFSWAVNAQQGGQQGQAFSILFTAGFGQPAAVQVDSSSLTDEHDITLTAGPPKFNPEWGTLTFAEVEVDASVFITVDGKITSPDPDNPNENEQQGNQGGQQQQQGQQQQGQQQQGQQQQQQQNQVVRGIPLDVCFYVEISTENFTGSDSWCFEPPSDNDEGMDDSVLVADYSGVLLTLATDTDGELTGTGPLLFDVSTYLSAEIGTDPSNAEALKSGWSAEGGGSGLHTGIISAQYNFNASPAFVQSLNDGSLDLESLGGVVLSGNTQNQGQNQSEQQNNP